MIMHVCLKLIQLSLERQRGSADHAQGNWCMRVPLDNRMHIFSALPLPTKVAAGLSTLYEDGSQGFEALQILARSPQLCLRNLAAEIMHDMYQGSVHPFREAGSVSWLQSSGHLTPCFSKTPSYCPLVLPAAVPRVWLPM